MRTSSWALALSFALLSNLALGQDRPSETELFESSDAPVERDGGAADTNEGRDSAELGGGPLKSKFDTSEAVSDPLKVGGSLLLFAQSYFRESRPFLEGAFLAPMFLDVYLDGRPSERLRAYAVGRLQFDPTFPIGARTSLAAGAPGPLGGLIPGARPNPEVFLDQLWLRFDIARKVYFTVGRQKIRWGVSRIWYPTDFLNSRPRDALNPFDARLGVNMLKVHVPVEALGWNFYAYGLLDAVELTSAGMQLEQLGGALRAEFVLGPAELGLGGVWQKGRRGRYALDVSSAIGPFDIFAEAAFRDAQDFLLFRYPGDLNQENLLTKLGEIEAYRPKGVMLQVSGGASWQFNYTDNNFAILAAEYFYNPAGYENPVGYQVNTFGPMLLGESVDPIQEVPLYGGKHNLAITLAAPGIPGADWISLSLSNIIILNDPSALTRLDAIFRVLSFLSVQAFAAVHYGQPGGQLRFKLSASIINDVANLSEAAEPGSGAQVRASLSPLRYPPLVEAGLLLRLAI